LSDEKASRPRRTREHVIAAQSVNYLEKFFIDKGHTVDRPAEDHGFDLIVNTFDDEGYAEHGDIRIQLKASDSPDYSDDGSYASLSIKVQHYHFWIRQPMPVFLVLYDARKAVAYWLYVQSYFGIDPARGPKAGAESVTLRIPVANVFTATTVDYARERKNLIVDQTSGIKHHD
jgi:hypothetical protein